MISHLLRYRRITPKDALKRHERMHSAGYAVQMRLMWEILVPTG